MPTPARFQRYLDQHPDHAWVALTEVDQRGAVCWLRDQHGRQRVAVTAADWARVPADCWVMAARSEGQVHLVAICDARVVAVLPVVGATGVETMPLV